MNMSNSDPGKRFKLPGVTWSSVGKVAGIL